MTKKKPLWKRLEDALFWCDESDGYPKRTPICVADWDAMLEIIEELKKIGPS